MHPAPMRWTSVTLCALALVVGLALSEARAAGTIQGFDVGPDGNHIVFTCDGLVGGHNAFVIGNPYRLVIDFDNTEVADVPASTRVEKGRIRAIRLGYAKSRARVVIDFGRTPVPAYKVHREMNRVLVALGRTVSDRGRPDSVKQQSRPRPARVKPAAKPPNPQRQTKPSQEVLLKSASVKGNTVVLHVARADDPAREARLAVELDLARFELLGAELQGKGGKKVTLEPPSEDHDVEFTDAEPEAKPERSQDQGSVQPAANKKSYQWGMPKVRPRGPVKRESLSQRGPFRLEQVTLRRRAE